MPLDMPSVNKALDFYSNREKTLTETVKKELYKTLDLSSSELFVFLETNSLLFASGKIGLELSQYVYMKLSRYASTTLVERIVLTKIFKEYIVRKALL